MNGYALATHIVGGEITMLYVPNQPNYNYVMSLNLYFDAINGNPAAEDPDVTLFIFRKKDNIRVTSFVMPMSANSPIRYKNPDCLNQGGLQTRRIEYSLPVYFNPDAYTDPAGYYVVWERCCRNNIITNIVASGSAAMTFYMEFPALKADGKLNLNSSPQYVPVQGDYICRNSTFQFDFSATDPDGDSLRYSLVTPYNGYATPSNPRPGFATPSSNYPLVKWNSGYSEKNQIPGTPPLQIDARTGELSVKANELGLYVFSVLVEEFRNGQKLGLVRRDFQLKVIDCELNESPKVFLREAGKSLFYNSKDTIVVKLNQGKCLSLLVTDSIPNTSITLSLQKVSTVLPKWQFTPNKKGVSSATDTLRSVLCIDDCTVAQARGKSIDFEVVATDDGCPASLNGRLVVKVRFETKPDNPATIRTDLLNNQGSVMVGDTLRFNVTATDIDNDSLSTTAKGLLSGIGFVNRRGVGKLTIPVTYVPTCAEAGKDNIITFVASQTTCGKDIPTDSVRVRVNVSARDSQRPQISTTLAGNATEVVVSASNPTTIQFEVKSKDPDNEPITLKGMGKGFEFKNVGITWSDKAGRGSTSSIFSWTPTCELLGNEDKKTFDLTFSTEDNSCSPNRKDSVTVKVTLVNSLANAAFESPNVFTPNGDGKNDYFAITNLPPDLCNEKFEGISIYNRWGNSVFEDNRRDFRWEGENMAAGEYFYLIRFTKHNYKGTISLLR